MDRPTRYRNIPQWRMGLEYAAMDVGQKTENSAVPGSNPGFCDTAEKRQLNHVG
jgi:hypothetical protein